MRLYAFVATSVALAAVVAACFPDYELGAAQPGSDATADMSASSSGGDGAGSDSSLGADSTLGDSSVESSSGSSGDAGDSGDSNEDASIDSNGGDAPNDAGSDTGNDAGVVAPSCETSGAGLTDCSDGGRSCCASLEVEGGTYDRTYANGGGGATGQADPAILHGFRLDEYEVTVGRFRRFVEAVLPPEGGTGWTPQAASGRHTHLNGGQGLVDVGAPPDAGVVYEPGWVALDDVNIVPSDANLACDGFSSWTSAAGVDEDLPINCLNWYEAYAFCIWDGGFLPSEAEWEYAAAGGSQQLEFPWGSAAPGTSCPGTGCDYAIYDCNYPSGPASCTSVANIAPVGRAALGAGSWGHLDLAGNVAEWTLDWNGAYVDPCTDCAYLTSGDLRRMVRGGSFSVPTGGIVPPFRNYHGPTTRSSAVGVRCARAP